MQTWRVLPLPMRHLVAAGALALISLFARASGPALAPALESDVRTLALAGSPQRGTAGITRVDVQIGRLDPRLRLAPCTRVQPYLPANARLWGKTRIGLRCTEGASRWNVFLPVTVKVYGAALVAAAPLAAGSVLGAGDLIQAEVDLAEDTSKAVAEAELVVGRTLSRSLNTGQSLRQSHLKPRQWFAAGETVKIVAAGHGFSVAAVGQALTPGTEGHAARVRTESGRVLTGMPVGERRLELAL